MCLFTQRSSLPRCAAIGRQRKFTKNRCLIKTPSSNAIDSNRRLFQLVNQYRLLILFKLTSECWARQTNCTDRSAPSAGRQGNKTFILLLLLHPARPPPPSFHCVQTSRPPVAPIKGTPGMFCHQVAKVTKTQRNYKSRWEEEEEEEEAFLSLSDRHTQRNTKHILYIKHAHTHVRFLLTGKSSPLHHHPVSLRLSRPLSPCADCLTWRSCDSWENCGTQNIF